MPWLPLLLPVLAACADGRDGGQIGTVAGLSAPLLGATPDDHRARLEANLKVLQRLEEDDELGPAERQALLDLFRSANRDGVLDADERELLSRLVGDLAAQGKVSAGNPAAGADFEQSP